ncbi:MAG: hypothetical protein KC464_03440 [Myxococcales bacterium]|nr:hypothetical protein [Myxococcales bacterium]
MTLLRIAALLTILGLIFMVWSVLQPTPLPVMLAMSVGQGVGTLAFLMFLLVVIGDLRKAQVLTDRRNSGEMAAVKPAADEAAKLAEAEAAEAKAAEAKAAEAKAAEAAEAKAAKADEAAKAAEAAPAAEAKAEAADPEDASADDRPPEAAS